MLYFPVIYDDGVPIGFVVNLQEVEDVCYNTRYTWRYEEAFRVNYTCTVHFIINRRIVILREIQTY